MNIRAILYNSKMIDRMKAGFSLDNRAKQAENTPARQHALSYHRFVDIRTKFMPVGPISKKMGSLKMKYVKYSMESGQNAK